MPLQDANPTPSFGGFGLRNSNGLTLVKLPGGCTRCSAVWTSMRSRVCLGNREWSALCEGCDNGRGRVPGTYRFSATGDGVCEKGGYQHPQTVWSYQHRICYQEDWMATQRCSQNARIAIMTIIERPWWAGPLHESKMQRPMLRLRPIVSGHSSTPCQLPTRVPRRHRRAGPPPSRHEAGELDSEGSEVLSHADAGAVAGEVVAEARRLRDRSQPVMYLLVRQAEDDVLFGRILWTNRCEVSHRMWSEVQDGPAPLGVRLRPPDQEAP